MAEVHYCSTPKILRHAEICKEINRLYEQKNHDYGDSFHQTFVEEGNASLRDGWTLKKRTVLRPIGQSESTYSHTMLYAELEKEVADDDAE